MQLMILQKSNTMRLLILGPRIMLEIPANCGALKTWVKDLRILYIVKEENTEAIGR